MAHHVEQRRLDLLRGRTGHFAIDAQDLLARVLAGRDEACLAGRRTRRVDDQTGAVHTEVGQPFAHALPLGVVAHDARHADARIETRQVARDGRHAARLFVLVLVTQDGNRALGRDALDVSVHIAIEDRVADDENFRLRQSLDDGQQVL